MPLLIILFFLAISAFIIKWLLPKPIPGIPSNRLATVVPLYDAFCMLLSVRKSHDLTDWLVQQNEKLGAPLVQVSPRPWEQPWVLLCDHAEAMDILLRNTGPDKSFDRSDFISAGLEFMGGALSRSKSFDPGWQASRGWLQDLMTPSYLYHVVGPKHLMPTAERLLRIWEMKAELAAGRPFSAGQDLLHFSLDMMLAFMFGPPDQGHFHDSALGPQAQLLQQMRGPHLGRALASGRWEDKHKPMHFPSPCLDAFLNACHDTCELVERLINAWLLKPTLWYLRTTQSHRVRQMQAIKEDVVKHQISGALARLQHEGKTPTTAVEHMIARELRIAEKEGRRAQPMCDTMVDEIYNQLLSGFHTTGSALGWVVKHLTAHQDVQARLRAELQAAFPEARAQHRVPDFEELQERRARLPVLDAVVEETLRLYGNTTTRMTTQDTTLLGRPVPKGTLVFLLSNGPGYYSPSVGPTTSPNSKVGSWSEQQRGKSMRDFDPARWLDDEAKFNPSAGPTLPFGGGPRGCFGRRLAYMEMRVLTALVVWRFHLDNIPEELAGHDAEGGIAYRARQCFLRLRLVRD